MIFLIRAPHLFVVDPCWDVGRQSDSQDSHRKVHVKEALERSSSLLASCLRPSCAVSVRQRRWQNLVVLCEVSPLHARLRRL